MGGEQHVDEVWLLERQERFGSVQINSSTSTTPLDLQARARQKKWTDVIVRRQGVRRQWRSGRQARARFRETERRIISPI